MSDFRTIFIPQYLLTVLTITAALPLLRSRDNEDTSTQLQSRKLRSINEAEEFLQTYGYFDKYMPGLAPLMDATSRSNAIRHYQRVSGLEQTGVLDDDTLRKMAQPRCGMPDTTPDVSTGELDKPMGFTYKTKWTKTSLTWKTLGYSRDLQASSQREAFTDAFKLWSDVTTLSFQEVSGSAPSDITIDFVYRNHGDGSDFDGPGKVVAHAFFPKDGKIHFDEEETWNVNSKEGTDLLMTATHEIGHALGLGHSEVSGVIMAPYYLGYEANLHLRDDDVQGIRYLYGEGGEPIKPPTVEGDDDVIANIECVGNYEAAFQTDALRVHVMRERYLWRTTLEGVLEEGHTSTSERYPDLPQGVTAAAEDYRGTTYFFQGTKVYKYESTGDRRVPGNLNQPQKLQDVQELRSSDQHRYPGSPEAALEGRDGRIYLIKDGMYYGFDKNRVELINGLQGNASAYWKDLPSHVDAAMDYNNHYYFFKDELYWKYDNNYNLLSGYPHKRDEPWMLPYCDNTTRAHYIPYLIIAAMFYHMIVCFS